jgi:uncharacterized membrane protein
VFFTRWVTHFCAPAFVFLAGTSAFLYGRAHDDLSRFLLTRGTWLVVLELSVIRLLWTFNLDFAHYMLAGVIWVIGWSMILMAGLVKLSARAVGAIGIVIVAAHDALGPSIMRFVSENPDTAAGTLGTIFYAGPAGGPVPVGPFPLSVLYSIIPWIGVMAAGYAFGTIVVMEPARRRPLCLAIGASMIALFLVLRGFNLYGNPWPWTFDPKSNGGLPPGLAFLNTAKYPASLDFLLMTLGPVIALIPLVESATMGRLSRWLTVFGRVPFFFYLLHIPLIHVLAIAVSLIRLGHVSPWLFANHPMGNGQPPDGYMWSLGWLYAVWLVAVVMLYFACRWYARVKERSANPLMSYL